MSKGPKARSFEARRQQWLLDVDAKIMAYRRRVKFYTRQVEAFPDLIERAAEANVRHSLEQLELHAVESLISNGYEVKQTEFGFSFTKPTGQIFTLPPGFKPKGAP